MTAKKKSRWSRLNNDQLQGANFGLRVLHTSPRVRGAALELLKELIEETYDELGRRKPAKKAAGKLSKEA